MLNNGQVWLTRLVNLTWVHWLLNLWLNLRHSKKLWLLVLRRLIVDLPDVMRRLWELLWDVVNLHALVVRLVHHLVTWWNLLWRRHLAGLILKVDSLWLIIPVDFVLLGTVDLWRIV